MDAVWAQVEHLTSGGTDLDAGRGLIVTGGPLATYFRVLVAPLFATALAWYAFFVSFHLGGTVATLVETATAALIGIAAALLMRQRLTRFRVVPLAWTTAAIGICVVAELDLLIHRLVTH
jgi:hypothetical protein